MWSKILSKKQGFYEPLTHSIASNEYHCGLSANILVFHSSGPSAVIVEGALLVQLQRLSQFEGL